MRRAAPVALVLPIASSGFLRSGLTLPSALDSPVLAVRPSESYQTDGSRFLRPQAAGSAAASSDRGVGAAPLREAPYPRWRRFGPGTGRTPAGGSASGPAITLDNLSWRRAIKVATSITSAGTAGKLFLAAIVLQRFRGCPDRGSPWSWPIIRRHSCACAAVSDSQARSCGSSSRPSGVTSRPPLNEKPAQGPVSFRSRTIRLHARVGAGAAARDVPATPR